MSSTTPNTTPVAVAMTPEQRLEALLEHTGDLDKAEALQASIPDWLANADHKVVQALNDAFQQSLVTQGKVATALKKLKPLDEFCKEQLTALLKDKWAVDVDVERDMLDISSTKYGSITPLPIGYVVSETIDSRSLLHAAMENFTTQEARIGGFSAASVIRVGAVAQTGTEITPTKFATLCRELDLGARYQRHIGEALALPPKPAIGGLPDERASTADIRRLKVLDMQVALHMAYLKKHITPAVYAMLSSVIEQDLPAAQTKGALFNGQPVLWQGLSIHDACICGVLVFTKVSIDTDPKTPCVVYMPNEPRRPFFEYTSLEDFKAYLTLHLQSTVYKKTFIEQYLHGHEKTDFFTQFDKGRTLGSLTATPADTCVADFMFSAFVSSTQENARILAVPTADVDEQQREKTIQMLLNGGLVLVNAASFFVPVIGQLMLASAALDLVSEVYEGVLDWTHGERTQALSHLLNVVENVAQMAAFAAGGKVVASALKKGGQAQAAFFDGLEAVTPAGGKAKLWKPDLEPYKQRTAFPQDTQVDAQGLYRHAGQTSIAMDGAYYGVTRNTSEEAWTLKHAVRTDAYQPVLERALDGGWRHAHEHAHEWRDGAAALGRTDPRLRDASTDLAAIAGITDTTPEKLHYLHESNLKLPQRVSDCTERFRLNRRITALITAMEQGKTANTDFVQEQLHTLPRLPGWPAERFIEVRDESGLVVSRFPKTAPVDDDANSVHVTQAQLDAGQLLDTVIKGLYANEVDAIIGRATTESKPQLLARKIGESLKGNRRPLHQWLYEAYDGTASGDVATLHEQATDLPLRVCQELWENASTRDRLFLRERKVLGVDLARQVSEARATFRQDRALIGLHLPQLANADTDKLALGLMDRLSGWEDGFRLDVRQGSRTGTLLDSVGEADASSRGTIVKTSTGYQVTQVNGNVSSTLASETLPQAILDALPATQRTRMGFTGDDALDVASLRSRLMSSATGDPVRTGRVLRGERIETPKHLSACAQANPPAVIAHSRGLIRKVKKLYPLFTDDQASAFLDDAGSTLMLRAKRVRELAQQLKTLRQVLHTWRDDIEQMEKLPGQLKDIRASRRQVANTIENCWRRVARRNQPATSLTLERSPVGALPALTEQDVAHVRSLSIKDMQAGDELAYFLRPFKGLVTLELDRNQLTRLPEALSHMPNLEHLRLDGNQIQLTEHTLRKLSDMRNLRTLGLSGNRLGATVDVRKMFDLQALILRDTQATELPVGLSRLPYLDFVDLRDNQIRELPAWLFSVPRQFGQTINLRNNPISPASRASLVAYRDATGVGMGLLDNLTVTLSEQRARDLWMSNPLEQSYASRNRAWLALKNEPGSTGFFELLAELGSSADSRRVMDDMTRRVWGVIDAAQADPGLCDQLLSLAVRANCADAAATIFSNLEVAVDIDRVVRQSVNAHDQAAHLLGLGRRLFRLDYLAKIAREDVLADPTLDPVEVELAYRIGLAERLELVGQPYGMRYASLSGVTPASLETAYNRITTAELTAELSTFISGREFWSDFLRRHHEQQFSDLVSPFHERMATAFESEETLGTQYRPTVDGIAAELKTAETALLKRLTVAAMEADEARVCFALD
ncbi:NEL-type E3 ubiquitin ligase domain-containing protein [Pseudomonas vancouverensis]|uniref:NEL-type E3 ubiquitin ligase domain-containing protein n=1 Tax=Pseudomonas vancouverensis TaxID=95300 RepID=UPI003D04D99F